MASLASLSPVSHALLTNVHFPVALRILQDSPQDADAFKCKVLAMIHQSAFNNVVTLLNKNAVLGKGMVFEKAYAGTLICQGLVYIYKPLYPSVRRSTVSFQAY